jgi:cytochrome c-type biogenesis protein
MGFTAVFSVLGFTASAVGSFFQDNKGIVLLLAAVIIMAFGLKFLNVMEIPFVDRVLRADASKAAATVCSVPFSWVSFLLQGGHHALGRF